jgi:triosephosphate isomerase
MNPQTLAETRRLFNSVNKRINNAKRVEVVVCPPFVYLTNLLTPKPYLPRREAKLLLRGTLNPKLGAQDCFWEQKGAFTGEISPKMLRDLGVKYVILGHSERRELFGETDEMVNRKVKAAINAKLRPVVCIANLTQLRNSLKGVSRKVIVAFEPLSAIGTGRPYSSEKAKKMRLKIKYPFVLYGGSVNSKNAPDYVKKAGFQGLLVGSASLNAREFVKVVNSLDEIV